MFTPIESRLNISTTFNSSKYEAELLSHRQASFISQFYHLIVRNIQTYYRKIKGVRAIFIIALFQALMISSFFTGVGSKKLIDIDKIMKMPLWKRKKELEKAIEWNTVVAKDYHGFAFFAATDQFVAIAVGQILQLPEINAVYLRESQSQMYSPSAFFLSKWLISTLVYMLEPIIYGTLSFYSVEVGEVTHYEYREFMAISILLALIASSFGYFFSTLFSND